MINFRLIYFLKNLLEDENLIKNDSPFKYGISGSAAKKIFCAFSVNLIMPLDIEKHFEKGSAFFKVSGDYTYCDFEEIKNYRLTVEMRGNREINAKDFNRYLKEYFYLKLIFKILFKGEGMVTKELVDLIKNFEGLSLSAYRCPSGVWTIGWGHTKDVKENDKITLREAQEFLNEDLICHENIVKRLVKVPLSVNQLSALTSFEYNVGEGNFKKSTLLKLLNLGNYMSASGEFLKWVYSRGKKLKGLIKRREAERKLFLRTD